MKKISKRGKSRIFTASPMLGQTRGQSAIEFAIIFGFVLFFFISFFAIIKSNQDDRNKEKGRIVIQNIALDVQKEISIAAEASNGYSREFKTPLNIFGKDYVINITEDVIIVNLGKEWVVYEIFPVIGSIAQGSNVIRKENDTVYLN